MGSTNAIVVTNCPDHPCKCGRHGKARRRTANATIRQRGEHQDPALLWCSSRGPGKDGKKQGMGVLEPSLKRARSHAAPNPPPCSSISPRGYRPPGCLLPAYVQPSGGVAGLPFSSFSDCGFRAPVPWWQRTELSLQRTATILWAQASPSPSTDSRRS